MSHVLASVTVESYGTLHGHLQEFITQVPVINLQRHLTARAAADAQNDVNYRTGYNNRWIDPRGVDDDQDSEQPVGKKGVVFDGGFSSWQLFRHEGRWFFYTKEDDDSMKIWRLRWSTREIEEMLKQINDAAGMKNQARTVDVYEPLIKEGELRWTKAGAVPRRPLESVCLAADVRQALFEDLDDFLDEAAPTWFAERGVSHRRGFFLISPPGTGKTTLIRVIASHWNLKIYQLSLTQPGLNDHTLEALFRKLGQGDMVVLEDIDCAGSMVKSRNKRPANPSNVSSALKAAVSHDSPVHGELSDASSRNSSDDDSSDDDCSEESTSGHKKKVKSKAKARRTSSSPGFLNDDESKQTTASQDETQDGKKDAKSKASKKRLSRKRVTLYGLLNAMDGTLTPEGYLLIMTSNHPEILDDALTRPGRVDQTITLGNACHEQIRDLFLKFYTPIRPGRATPFDVTAIPQLAEVFADIVPDNIFSPAQIQQYLLSIKNRRRPDLAFDGVAEWVKKEKNIDLQVTMKASDILGESAVKLDEAPVLQLSSDTSGVADLFTDVQSNTTSTASGTPTSPSITMVDPMPEQDSDNSEGVLWVEPRPVPRPEVSVDDDVAELSDALGCPML